MVAVVAHLKRIVLLSWAAGLAMICSTLMASHLITLPEPDPDLSRRALATLRPEGHLGGLVVHVMYVDCGCSRRILDHLAARPALDWIPEHVLLVGDAPEDHAALLAQGYDVDQVSRDELANDFHIEAAPLLAVLGGDDALRYLGGYTSRKRGPDILDVAMIHEAMAEGIADTLPLFGCATSASLQQTLDPLGLKY